MILLGVIGLHSMAYSWGWEQVSIKNTIPDTSIKISVVYLPGDKKQYYRYTPSWVPAGTKGNLDLTSPKGGSERVSKVCVKIKFKDGTIKYYHIPNGCINEASQYCTAASAAYTVSFKDQKYMLDFGYEQWWELSPVSSCPQPSV